MTELTESNPAEVYQSFLVPAVFAPWAEELLRRADPAPEARVLDVGCGTGVVARAAARVVGERGAVTGLDINPAMLEIARRIPSGAGTAPLTWVRCPADDIRYPDGTFDLVTCQQMLQFAPDRAAVLREMRRVLAPGGRAAVAAWAGAAYHPEQVAMEEAIARHTGRSEPALTAGFALSDPEEIRALLEGAGFRVVSLDLLTKEARFPEPRLVARRWLLAASAGIPSFRQLDGDARDALIEAIAADLTGLMQAKTVDDHVVVPWHAHIAVAEA